MKWFFIGTFGVAGVLFRYATGAISTRFFPGNFPLGTFTVNMLGAFLAGILYAYAIHDVRLSSELRLGLTVGFLGGFTTFSAFCVESLKMFEEGSLLLAAIYLGLSPMLGFLLAISGAWFFRRWVT